MTERKDHPDTSESGHEAKTLSLGKKTLGLKTPAVGPVAGGASARSGRQTVTVEVKKRRVITPGSSGLSGVAPTEVPEAGKSSRPATPVVNVRIKRAPAAASDSAAADAASLQHLTSSERESRLRALQEAMKTDEERRRQDELERMRAVQQQEVLLAQAEQAEKEKAETPPLAKSEHAVVEGPEVEVKSELETVAPPPQDHEAAHKSKKAAEKKLREEEEEKHRVSKRGMVERRQHHHVNVRMVPLTEEEAEDVRERRNFAARRYREKSKTKTVIPPHKIVREVALPDVIVVSELANRMSVRGSEVVKKLMELGSMVTLNQVIDADTAQIIIEELGHKVKRVSESELEDVLLQDEVDVPESLQARAPVVTVMGHVDHGKTSLLDALRETDVAAGEAGGITQHIGAYQVTLKSGAKITFIDTPGHAAFTEMRARGANVTDIVVLVVAADDGIQQQTIEAIDHAKAAGVPIVVAVNKVDKPEADPSRVRHELLQHDIVVEELGGEVIAVDVSAKKHMNLDGLEEAILLQSEILELKANPDRSARGVVIEAKLERGRGIVATVLVQKGTLKVGDIFLAGEAVGRVRAIVDSHGVTIREAGPSMPVEVLGWDETPAAGDVFAVVENEAKAREVTLYRRRLALDARAAEMQGSLVQLLQKVGEGAEGPARELQVILKADVQGSIEAITGSLQKLSTDEVRVRVIHSGVGGINESDIALAYASKALVLGFNVRANAQARDAAAHNRVEIRYYSVIYALIEECKNLLEGLLAPTLQENTLGRVQIRQIFTSSQAGKIAGCMVTNGIIRRSGKIRLLRDDVVIYDGEIKALRRGKDEVKEVREGFECGISIEGFQDIREGDEIECYEIESIQRTL